MKATELQIGNIVKYRGSICKVYSIESPMPREDRRFDNKYIVTLFCNGLIVARIEEIQHVILTKEMLKENGFSPFGNDAWAVGHYELIRDMRIHIGALSMSVAYVHQLQNALRLCKYDDLADNFKVNI